MLSFIAQLVSEMRLTCPALNAALLDKTITFQRKQVGSHGVICQVEILGQLIDRFPGAPQQAYKSTSRTAEKSFVEISPLHLSRSIAQFSNNYNKSS